MVSSKGGNVKTIKARPTFAHTATANAGVSSGEFGIHATLLAGLGDREISGEALRDVADEAVKAWKKQHAGELEGGLTVGLKDVTTRGSYFQVRPKRPTCYHIAETRS